MIFHVLTLFPEMIEQACGHSILKRAADSGRITVRCVDIREYAVNKHGQVDDAPYGGGAGMVMMAPPVFDAYLDLIRGGASVNEKPPRLVYLTPQGRQFTQSVAEELSAESGIILLCGHYEGIDQRVIDLLSPDEISIGDFIITGGELGALVIIDAVSRLLPGVLGKEESHKNESFARENSGLLEYPQYTRPPVFNGMEVPPVLLSGNHKEIALWRREQALIRTKEKRPELIEALCK